MLICIVNIGTLLNSSNLSEKNIIDIDENMTIDAAFMYWNEGFYSISRANSTIERTRMIIKPAEIPK
jgi:hypothetical protein